MRLFDHFGHFAHGHGGVLLAIAIGVLVAIALSFAGLVRSRKDTDA